MPLLEARTAKAWATRKQLGMCVLQVQRRESPVPKQSKSLDEFSFSSSSSSRIQCAFQGKRRSSFLYLKPIWLSLSFYLRPEDRERDRETEKREREREMNSEKEREQRNRGTSETRSPINFKLREEERGRKRFKLCNLEAHNRVTSVHPSIHSSIHPSTHR